MKQRFRMIPSFQQNKNIILPKYGSIIILLLFLFVINLQSNIMILLHIEELSSKRLLCYPNEHTQKLGLFVNALNTKGSTSNSNHHNNNNHGLNKNNNVLNGYKKRNYDDSFVNNNDDNGDNGDDNILPKRRRKRRRNHNNNDKEIQNIIQNESNIRRKQRQRQKRIRVSDFSKLEFIVGDDDNNGQWMSALLADIRDKFNTDEVTEKVGFYSYIHSDKEGNHYQFSSPSYVMIRGGGGRNYRSQSNLGLSTTNNIQVGEDYDHNLFDSFGKSFSLFTAGIVVIQSITSILSHEDFALLDEIAAKLLSAESAIAMKTIRDIIQNFPEHGVIDVFSEYPTKDVVVSILALSRLQNVVHVSSFESSSSISSYLMDSHDSNIHNGGGKNSRSNFFRKRFRRHRKIHSDMMKRKDDDIKGVIDIDDDLLADLAHYSIFANAAYGWKMGLLGGKLHLGDLKTLLRRTGIDKTHVIQTSWKAKTHLPAYFLVRDVQRKKIVLCIRGTLSPKDILTDLCCTAEDFMSHEEEHPSDDNNELTRDIFKEQFRARAHQGMVNSARSVAKMTHELIASELAANPGYQLVLVGHSLGGGVASILGTFWKHTFPGTLTYAYGCPCVAPLNAYPTIDESVISVVGEGDPFSCLSLGHLADVTNAISQLCEDPELRNNILNRTKDTKIEEMSEDDIAWCKHTLELLSPLSTENGNGISTEKFYPPGRVLHMKGNLFSSDLGEVSITEVQSEDVFRHLKLHPRMFDLSLHIPHRYEVLLTRIWSRVRSRTLNTSTNNNN